AGGRKSCGLALFCSRLTRGAGSRRGLRCRREPGQNLLAWSKSDHLALVEDKCSIECSEGTDTMRDHNHDRALRAHDRNRAGQRGFAFRVEIGIRLVEHNKKWIAVKRPRQSKALPLAG